MELIFLGTGGSWPSKDRNVASVALRIGSDILIFDCGEGTQRQLMLSQISFMKINKIFISHFHGDHFLGLPGLIQSMALNNRKALLEIYGPKGTSKLLKTLLTLGYFTPTFKVKVFDLKGANEILRFDSYFITACQAEHNVPALAYAVEEYAKPGRFNVKKAKALGIPEGPLYRKLQNGETIYIGNKKITSKMVLGKPRKGRKIVYANDTKPCENIIKIAKNCDVLIHDATVSKELEKKANKFGHSSATQAAEVAKSANARVLFLIHFSPRYKSTNILEAEAKKVFPNSIAARDFMVYEVRV